MSINKWLLVAETEKKKTKEDVPDCWKSREQLEEIWGIKVSQANRKIRNLIKDGLIERKTFRVDVGSKVYPIPHYKLK